MKHLRAARAALVSAALLFFAVWDAILALVAIRMPGLWFDIFHGTAPADPQGLLVRTGAVWAAFSLFHFIAWRNWKAKPWWLIIVGGMRLGEIFADIAYLLSATNLTIGGAIGLLIATPSNLLFGFWFIRTGVKRSAQAAST